MAMPEILAPAGGQEQLAAAVRCGAEAIYLGLPRFNARQNAANFDGAGLAQAARYCRARNVKLYVTVNTLVLDEEQLSLEETAEQIAQAGVYGVILQDMAALRLFQKRWPGLHRTASTQTAVHNRDGARFLQDAGFDSFVLARELTAEEMGDICAAVTIPAEAFVHGAHCMSLSGACYLSAMLGGRSGNRGLCAQPCRLNWRCGGRDYALSLKDMSLLAHMDELRQAGVHTLKIEGRMKRPEYVAAAVTACRKTRAGEPYDQKTLEAVFSRSGFTDGYLTGQRDIAMFGHRTEADAASAGAVLGSLAALYRRETPLVPVDMVFSMTAQGSRLIVSDGKNELTVPGPLPETAHTRSLDEETAERSLKKTGNTQYYVNRLDVHLDSGLTLSAAALNALRRQSLEELDEVRAAFPAPERGDYSPVPIVPREAHAPSPLWARFPDAAQLEATPCLESLARLLLPVAEITPALLTRYGPRLTAQLPALLFPGDEEAPEARLQGLKKAGLEEVWTDNIYGIPLGKRLGLTVRGGWGLNVTNTQAVDFYESLGLASLTASFELPMEKLRRLGGTVPLGLAAYGRLPLMRFRSCPVKASIGCKACGGHGTLTDRRGVVFPVECDRRQYSTLLNSVPLHIAGRDDPSDFRLLYFTDEDGDRRGQVIGEFLEGRPSTLPRTGGLYYRQLL